MSDHNILRKVALYVRVSTTYQVEKDSLPMQREDLINYAKYVLNIDKYEVFEDAGYSAKSTERPAYQQMMSRLRDREFSHLLVWKIDRISRNLIDFSEMYNELKKLGVTFVSKNEQFQTDTPMGEAMLKIILVFAELERKMTSERVSSVMISRANKGQWNGGKVPYGYDYDKTTKEFTINPVEAAVVERMFTMYETCPSLLAIARELNSEGITTKSGIAWTPVTVSRLLHNIFYTGAYRYNRLCESNGANKTPTFERKQEDWVIYPNHHPAIIDKARQDRVLEKLASQKRGGWEMDRGKSYMRKNVHIFAGLISCGVCGSTYQSTSDKMRSNGYVPSVYLCARRRRFSDCDNSSVSDAYLGPFVLNYVANIIKVQNSFGKSTSVDTLESKLLRGEALAGVTGIEQKGLLELYDLLRQKFTDVEFTPSLLKSNETKKPATDEKDLLLSDKRKAERALQRLQQLYLYEDDEKAISDKEYIIQRQEIQDNLARIDKRLAEIEKSESKRNISDDDFVKQATYFIMANKLNDRRYVNYSKFIQSMDKAVIKEFVQSVISKIVVLDSKIVSIRFMNGIEHKFLYG